MNNLSSADLQRIRDNAADAKAVGKYDSTAPWMRFLRDANPDFVIAVLDELLALREAAKAPYAITTESEMLHVRHGSNGYIMNVSRIGNFSDVIPLFAAPQQPAVPEGWVMVPRKITLEMECALSRADSYEIGWQWAIAAAPKPEVK